MTWSPFFTEVTPGPTSTTMPAHSWPKITGNRPSGSAPERVNSSVWHTPEARIPTMTPPASGPSRSTVTTSSGLPAAYEIAAFDFMRALRAGVGGESNHIRRLRFIGVLSAGQPLEQCSNTEQSEAALYQKRFSGA